MDKTISIVIPNFNGKELLQKNLPHVVNALNAATSSGEIIIVDDCSTDESVEFLKNMYPQIVSITNDKNSGFGFSVNKGVSIAKGDIVLLLNNDILLPADYFQSQLPCFEHEDTFGVCSTLVYPDNRLQEAGWYPYYQKHRLRWKMYSAEDCPAAYLPTLYLCGGNALIDRKKFLKIGGFAELFAPFYIEDVDLSIRAWRAGYKVYYAHNTSCIHDKSSTIEKHFRQKAIEVAYHKNFFLLQLSHADRKNLLYWRWKFLLYAFKYIIKRKATVKRSSYFEARKHFSKAVAFNHSLNRNSKFTLSEIILQIKEDLRLSPITIR